MLSALLALTIVTGTDMQTPPKEERIEWWREARFGMFIHWGLYAIPAGEWNGKQVPGAAEWIMHSAQIPVKDYEPLKDQFNPVNFDADEWVRIAKDAGMKYIVITSKHHDGFALWDSKVSDYDVMSSPYGKDILKQLAEACRRGGIKLGFYHSILDWRHPDYGQRRPWDARPEAGQPDMNAYTRYMKAQLKELLTEYGDVAVVWFDGEWEAPWTHERGVDLYDYVLSLQPNTLVNNRVDKGRNGMQGMTQDGGYRGDFGTPEQEIPARGLPGVDWESCMTMNGTWGFDKNDHNWKSSTTLIQNLIDIASKGGNYLLNVGPTAAGEIPQASVERLKEMGDWLRVNGEALYGTTASPFAKSPYRWTQKPGALYLHIFNWPGATELTIPGIQSEIAGVYAITAEGEKPLLFSQRESLAIQLPAEPLSPHASVIRIAYVGDLKAEDVGLAMTEEGITLPSSLAEIHGTTLKPEGGWLGYWTDEADWAGWDFEAKPGEYHLELEYACSPSMDGSTALILLGENRIELKVQSTGSWQQFITAEVGTVRIGKAGPATLIVRPGDLSGGALMNLKSVRLVKADSDSLAAKIAAAWNFGDPAGSRERFLALAESLTDPTAKLIVKTQIARTYSLSGQFQEADGVLDGIGVDMSRPSELTTRVLLERGRVLNSSGKPAEAVPVFEQALDHGVRSGEEYLALDAVHMLAIAAPAEESLRWHAQGFDMLEAAKTRRGRAWAGPMLNNYGWTLFDAGQTEKALEVLQKAWEYRKTRPEAGPRRIAAYAVGRVLRELKRYDEALAIQSDVLKELNHASESDGFVLEEMGELMLALGRGEESRDYFAQAYALLSQIDWLAESEPDRLKRIKGLADQRVD